MCVCLCVYTYMYVEYIGYMWKFFLEFWSPMAF